MSDAASAPLIVFGEDWGAHPSSTQHVIRRIVETRPVIWVNSIGMRRPRLSLSDGRRVLAKLGAMLSSGRRRKGGARQDIPAGLTVINPRAISWPGNPLAHAATRVSVGLQVRAALRAIGSKNPPILWLSLPSAACMVGAFGESAVVYYVGDDFSALEGVDHAPVERMEHRLAAKADAIIAASDRIAARFPRDKTHIITHGCDFESFSEPADIADDLHPVEQVRRPVAGFYGSLSGWLDQDLIAGAAERLPDWRFVMIGEERCDLSRLKKVPNIEFLGPRPHDRLAGYVQHWDASLIPFRDTAQIRACNPLKLREYLAAGTPIVSTDFPALDRYRDHVSVAADADAFAKAIEDGLNEDAGERFKRRKTVERESWAAKARDTAILLGVLQNETSSQNDTVAMRHHPA